MKYRWLPQLLSVLMTIVLANDSQCRQFSSTVDDQLEARVYIRKAENAQSNGDYERAVANYRTGLKFFATEETVLTLATCYSSLARSLRFSTEEKDAENRAFHYYLLAKYFDPSHLDSSIAVNGMLANRNIDPNSAEQLDSLAEKQIAEGHLLDAIVLLKQAQLITNSKARLARLVYCERNKSQDSDYLPKADEFAGTGKTYVGDLGQLLVAAKEELEYGWLEPAYAQLTYVLRRDPKNIEAKALLQQLNRLQLEQSRSYFAKAQAAYQANDIKKAASLASSALRRNSSDAELINFYKKVDFEDYPKKEVDFGDYMSNMQQTIKSSWMPPVKTGRRKASVVFEILPDGKINHVVVYATSGDKIFDAAAKTAVLLAGSLGPLPQGSPDQVLVRFDFDMKVGPSKSF